ncbi:hypothetical protein RHGRI_011205 [Rhododendron griersonianum]|uniref:Uncharacterized protein n=1 Tax=Rhododendron griersonianum TaxID=479676 RepID=A0AAV6KM86_9ERIC|nr:hypothetical protein RHGRI_011205 [Rhododendron griersonianum]
MSLHGPMRTYPGLTQGSYLTSLTWIPPFALPNRRRELSLQTETRPQPKNLVSLI